jgi:hypothetical protein
MTEHEICSDPLADDRTAEAAVARVVGKVYVAPGIELLDLFRLEEALREHARMPGPEQGGVWKDGFQVSMATPGRLGVAAEVDVRGACALSVLQELVDMGDLHPVVEILVRGF